jgi:hypothetical protein
MTKLNHVRSSVVAGEASCRYAYLEMRSHASPTKNTAHILLWFRIHARVRAREYSHVISLLITSNFRIRMSNLLRSVLAMKPNSPQSLHAQTQLG